MKFRKVEIQSEFTGITRIRVLAVVAILIGVCLGLSAIISVVTKAQRGSPQVQLVHTIKNDYVITALAWRPDSSELAVGQNLNKKITIWNTDNGQIICTLDKEAGGTNALAYSPDGRYLAVGRSFAGATPDKAHVQVYDAVSGRLIHDFESPVNAMGGRCDTTSLAISPDSRYLVANGYRSEGIAAVYEIATGVVVSIIAPNSDVDGHFGKITALAYSPDGCWLAVGRYDRDTSRTNTWGRKEYSVVSRVEIWSTSSWKVDRQTSPDKVNWPLTINAMAFSPDNRCLVLGLYGKNINNIEIPAALNFTDDIILLDPATLRITRSFPRSQKDIGIKELAFTPDGRFLVSGATAKSVVVHGVESQKEEMLLTDFQRPAHPALSADGRYIAVTTGKEIRLYSFHN